MTSRWTCLGATLIAVQTGSENNTVSMKTSVVGRRKTGTGWRSIGPHLGPGRAPLRDTRIATLLVLAGGSRCQRSQTHTGKTSRCPFNTIARPIWARSVQSILYACGRSISKRSRTKQQGYHSHRLVARMYRCGFRGSFDRFRNLLSHRCESKKPALGAAPGRAGGCKRVARIQLGTLFHADRRRPACEQRQRKQFCLGICCGGTNSIG
jgi:hypothetical protein